MYVCHCRAVTDRTIREAIESGATDVFQVSRECGAGSGCGGCYPALAQLLGEYGLAPTVRRRRAVHAA